MHISSRCSEGTYVLKHKLGHAKPTINYDEYHRGFFPMAHKNISDAFWTKLSRQSSAVPGLCCVVTRRSIESVGGVILLSPYSVTLQHVRQEADPSSPWGQQVWQRHPVHVGMLFFVLRIYVGLD